MFPWQDLATTFFGALLGVVFGLLLDQYRDRSERRKRTLRTLLGIIGQLDDALETLEQIAAAVLEIEPLESGAVKMEFSVVLLSTLPLEAAIQSGDITLLEPDLQTEVGRMQESLRLVKLMMDHLNIHVTNLDATASSIGKARNIATHLRLYCDLAVSIQAGLKDSLRAALLKHGHPVQ